MPGKYINSIKEIKPIQKETIIGHLSLGVTNHQLLSQQRVSWANQIDYLQSHFENLQEDWKIIFEYPIPRRAKRIDLVLLTQDLIIVIEFKDKAIKYFSEAIRQVEDYSLDLRDFHKESYKKIIIPIVWSSDAIPYQNEYKESQDCVKPTLFANNETLSIVINESVKFYSENKLTINCTKWNNSEYLPTPTIIEAAQHMFAGQDVAEISRSHAGSENLTETTRSYFDFSEVTSSTPELPYEIGRNSNLNHLRN